MPINIHCIGGTGHKFIGSLVINLINNDPSLIQFSKTGNAHKYSLIKSSNIVNFVIGNDDILYFDKLKQEDENFKFIFIWFSDEEQLLIEYNHVYKRHLNNVTDNNAYYSFYKEEMDNRQNVTSLLDLSESEIHALITNYIEKRPHGCKEKLYRWSILKNKYPENIFIINYNDILNDMNKVLDTLELITDRKRTDGLVQSYKNYLEAQSYVQDKLKQFLPK